MNTCTCVYYIYIYIYACVERERKRERERERERAYVCTYLYELTCMHLDAIAHAYVQTFPRHTDVPLLAALWSHWLGAAGLYLPSSTRASPLNILSWQPGTPWILQTLPSPEGPSTQIQRYRVPSTRTTMAFGTCPILFGFWTLWAGDGF